jgi:hypothetical protein
VAVQLASAILAMAGVEVTFVNPGQSVIRPNNGNGNGGVLR